MKKQTLSLVSLFLGMIFSPAYGQTGGIKVNVPFQFTVAGKSLPAGAYVFSSTRGEIWVRNSHGNGVAMALVNSVDGHSPSSKGELMFHCYRSRCFLSQLWNPLQGQGQQLLQSEEEKEAAKQDPATYFALIGLPSKH